MPSPRLQDHPRAIQLTKQHPAYLSYLKHLERRNARGRTIETYADCLRGFHRWLTSDTEGSPVAVTPADLDRFLIHLTRGNGDSRAIGVGRRGTYVAVLRDFYAHAHRERLTLSNPAADLKAPKLPRNTPGSRDTLTPADLRRLLRIDTTTAEGQRDAVAIRLMALSGLRASEVCRLDVGDVDLAGRELTVRQSKGRRDRLVFFDTTTRPILASYLSQARPSLIGSLTPTLVIADHGRCMDRDRLRAVVNRRARSAGIPGAGCHDLRRAFCTLLLSSGGGSASGGLNIKMIAELAGHRRLRTTARYVNLDIHALSQVYRETHPRAAPGSDGGGV